MQFLRSKKDLFVSLVIVYVFLVVDYFFTSLGIRPSTLYLQMRRYIPCAVAVAIAVSLWKRAGLEYKTLLPHAIVGLVWALVYPVCYWLTFKDTLTFIDNHYDQSFGAYFFAFSICLRLILLKMNGWHDNYLLKNFFGTLHTLVLLIPLFQIVYYFYYKYPVTESASIALLQTNPSEAKEFLLLNLGYFGIVGVLVCLIVIFKVFCRWNALTKISKNVDQDNSFSKKIFVLCLVVLMSTVSYGSMMFKKTGVMQTYVFAKEYFEKTNMFKVFHDKNYEQLEVTPTKPPFSKPSTVIMVIGESASSYYMSAYSDVKNDNTPWMRSMKSNDNFVLFSHAYTSRIQTVPALERALTEKNQYNDKEFNQSLTILDIAKKAGYETYWFSNQGFISDADTPITLVARTADHAKWLCEDKTQNGKTLYDGGLLEYLKQVDSNKNNFIVMHFMGSHEDCINRYPAEITKFGQPHKYDMLDNFDNSILYTDYLLKNIYSYASNRLNLKAMVYFSDHGSDPYRKRHPEDSEFKASQIPLFVYTDNEYNTMFADKVKIFREHRNSYFTNDLIYELVCDLLQIKSNHFIEENSLLNVKYKYTRDTLTTDLGKVKLSEDKEPRKDL